MPLTDDGQGEPVAIRHLAAGRFDVYYEQGLKPWDLAAGVVLAQEAGATVSRYDGTPVEAAKGEKRWLKGFYLDVPEEWDDSYRFFRW